MVEKSASSATMAPLSLNSSEEFFAFPLTSGQRAMWQQDTTALSDPRFNGAFRLNLEGAVRLDLLEKSLRDVANHQESLRTSFRIVDAELQQVVFPRSEITVDELDLRHLDSAQRDASLDATSISEATQQFDLTLGAPIRVKLIRMEDHSSVLTLTLHQIICDGWSIGILMEELSAAYAAFARDQPSPLEPLTFQFGDYVTWRREHSSWTETSAQLDYWRQKLDLVKQVQVAPDFDNPSDSNSAGILSKLLPRDLTDSLRTLSQKQNTTFYVVSMAACLALLSRYTGSDDIAVRTPLAGRTRVEFEPIIGQFVNQVAIRSHAAADLTFSEFLDSVRETVWEALANQDAPFEEVLQIVSPSALAANTLFNINFVCQREYGRNGPSTFEFDGVKMTSLPSKSQGALYDLNFFMVEREAGWRLSIEYKTALYTEATAASLLLHFEEILNQVAEAAQTKLSDLSLSATEAFTRRIQAESPPIPAFEDSPSSSDILAMPGSLAQERFWTLSQLDPLNPSFHVPLVMKLSGPLSSSLLQQSLQVMIDRHESLRTTFSERDGEFFQIIHPSYTAVLRTITVPGNNDSEKAGHLAAAIEKEIEAPFDLSELPLFRSVLCSLSAEENVLIVTLHHILADAASAQVIQRELFTAYENLQSGELPDLPPLAIQYGDYSVWQREALDSEAMKAHLAYWLGQLAGDLKVIDFPTDRPPAYRPTAKGSVETMLLPAALTASLKQLAQANDTTLYVVTLACFAAMLSRASDATDLTIGSPVLNRRQETEALIGPFAGPMAMRINLGSNPTLTELIRLSRDRTLEGLDHAELPFELILRNLTLRTQHGRRPLFQFYFLCQTAFVQSRTAGPLTIVPLPSVSVGTPFEMQLALIERPEGVRAELEYSSELFDKLTVEKWLAYYKTLLSEAVSSPGQRLADLPAPPFKPVHSSAGSRSRQSKHLQAGDSLVQPYVAPRDLVEEMVAQIWEEVLGVPSISVHANFFDLGGTSFLILKLVPRINVAFDILLPVPTIFNAPTIELMANILRKRNTIEKQVVLPLHPSGNRTPLFMIHSYHLYRALPSALGNDQPFYGIMELELTDRRPPYTLKAQIENYVKHIRSVQPTGPYYIAGFCFFGLLAFEVAAQLETLGQEVAFIGLVDTYCPEYWSNQLSDQPTSNSEPNHLLPRSSAPLWHHLDKTKGMTLSEKMRSHIAFAQAKLHNQRLSLLLEARVSLYTYFISRGINLPNWLRDPSLVTRVGVRRHKPARIASNLYLFPAEDVPLDANFDPTLGWGTMTSGEVKTMWIPGDHADMFKENHIGALAKTIRRAMDLAHDEV